MIPLSVIFILLITSSLCTVIDTLTLLYCRWHEQSNTHRTHQTNAYRYRYRLSFVHVHHCVTLNNDMLPMYGTLSTLLA